MKHRVKIWKLLNFRHSHRSCGFTLIELTLVIVIIGAIAGSVIVFLVPAMGSYADTKRRAGLADQADTALRRMAQDIRIAVPNSIRSPSNQCFELVPTITGGRYRMARHTGNDSTPNCTVTGICSAPLDTSQPATRFDVLTPMSTEPAVGDWVVIGNQEANDVYSGVTRTAITGISTPNSEFGQRRISFNAKQFPVGYDGGRFSITGQSNNAPAVFYICHNAAGLDANGNGTGTLFRLNRAFDANYPSSCPAPTGAAVLARNVRSCSFVYDPSTGSTQQRGFVWMKIDLAEANEVVSLMFGAHVDNVP